MEKVLKKLASGTLSVAQMDILFDEPRTYPSDLIQDLAKVTALSYWEKTLDFPTADRIMNNLFGYWTGKGNFYHDAPFGAFAWECYLAFDAGEYKHPIEPNELDPIQAFTDVALEKLLKAYQLL